MNVKRSLVPVVSLAAVVLLAAGCGESRDESRPMTPGEELARNSGCTACHGSNGEGGVGPKWQGLFGTDVKLSDGSTVVADDAYLAESIGDPSAKARPGYGAMPPNSLNDAEIAQVVEFIKSLES